ncbi:hypothetical protein [Sutcliffiella deserti]|uniref:hypothetical protein n=1 Tax=Sutcliffiella deserti TaxID=2875501 RepID=UPI001CBF4E6F|nr:hypothetical protein [Sutcliffiella deserti]
MAGLFILFLLWFNHHKVIDGEYTKLTIKMPHEGVAVIEEKERIDEIIEAINEGPRNFGTEKPFYYYEVASLIFENEDGESEAVHYKLKNKNIKIRFGEVKTDLNFEQEDYRS